MNPKLIGTTVRRVVLEIAADRRTVVLMLALPSLLLTLMYFVYDDNARLFNSVATMMLGVFPLLLMFIVASVTMQCERGSGTLERLWVTPLNRLDLLIAYGVAFSVFALLQAVILVAVAHWLLGVETAAPLGWVFVVSPITGMMGGAFGLLASAFAANEFQAVQFMPAFIGPQFFLCGILVPRDEMNSVLEAISNVLPLSYAVDALRAISSQEQLYSDFGNDIAVLVGFFVLALVLAALSMPRTTK